MLFFVFGQIDKENTSTKAPAPVNTAAKPMIRPPFKAAENAAPSSSTTTNVPKATSQVLKENSGNAPKDHHKTSAEVIKPVSVQPMKPAVQQCPAPSSARLIQHSAGESYEISDREDSSDEDYDYSDEEEAAHKKAHKKVPDWARGDALKMVSSIGCWFLTVTRLGFPFFCMVISLNFLMGSFILGFHRRLGSSTILRRRG